MIAREHMLNEALLANVFKWIEKVKQDNVHGEVLQLQLHIVYLVWATMLIIYC